MMKSIIALFLFFYLLRDGNIICARKEQGDYWEKIMMSQPMPEAIKELIEQDQRVSDSWKGRFSRDFDIKPNVILYHTNHMSRDQKLHGPESKLQPDAMVEQSIKRGS